MRTVALIILLISTFLIPTLPTIGHAEPEASEPKASEIAKELDSAFQTEQDAQKKLAEWLEERAELQSRISELKKRKRWLDHQNKQHHAYIAKQKEVLADLEHQQTEMGQLKVELEPYLEEVVRRLAEHVKNDLAFLPDERARRIEFLEESLKDYRVDLSEKLRRVMEALKVEAQYGREVEVIETTVELDGDKVHVYVLRLGRLALFYRTPDGRRIGRLTPSSGGWQPLPLKYSRELNKALEIAERRRVVELVRLPILNGVGSGK